MIKPRQIEAFRAVIETGSVTRAAERLHVTQPAVSKLIMELERATRITLFVRHRRRVVPTPEASLLAEEVERRGYPFPYLFDESQEIARAYGAACTPDFFLFDNELRLVYRGQLDDSRPANDVPVTGNDLREGMNALLEGRPVPQEQKAGIGCGIKWKEE